MKPEDKLINFYKIKLTKKADIIVGFFYALFEIKFQIS